MITFAETLLLFNDTRDLNINFDIVSDRNSNFQSVQSFAIKARLYHWSRFRRK